MNPISDYLYAKASKNKIPINAAFELSPVCNFSCKMCYVRKTPGQIAAEGKRLRTWEEWIALAEQCREAGTLYLLLTGGEPFLYPEFRKLYEALHYMGFIISINTNGTMIDSETVDWLKKVAPSRLNITLYGGGPETYERICGCADGYERAVNAIRMLKAAGIPIVINVSMIPENADDLEKIIDFGREHEIYTRVTTYMFPPSKRQKEKSDSRFTASQAAEMYLRKIQCMRNKEDYRLILQDMLDKVSDASNVSDDSNWGENMEYMRCRAGRSSYWVSWDGTMTACGIVPFPTEVYPFERPFSECWKELTDTVRSTRVMSTCNKCSKKEICNPCVAMLHAETGSVDEKAPYLCEMADCLIAKIKLELGESV